MAIGSGSWGDKYGLPATPAPVRSSTGTYSRPSVSPASMPKTSPLKPNVTSQLADRSRTASRQRLTATRTARQAAAKAPTAGMGGASGTSSGASSVGSLFAPLFDALEQQMKNAESRYAENAGQIQNIYGQLIGARKADVADIQTAYQRLQQAAASRGAETLGAMQARETGRVSQNEAVLQSMGVGGIGTTRGDIASQSAAVAQDVERLNQSNWAGMLDI